MPTTVMKWQPQYAAPAALLLVLAAVILPLKEPFNWYDEGFTVLNATRVLNGELPYRDFWTIYPPAQFYALAFAFKLFGTNLLTARLYDAVVRLAILLGVYRLSNRIISAPLALLATVLAGVTVGAAGFYTYAVFPALALGVCALAAILTYITAREPIWLIVSGILIGLALLFRIDIGVYAAIAGSVVLSLSRHPSVRAGGRPTASAIGRMQPIAVLGGAALMVAVPVYALLAVKVGPTVLWDQLIGFPVSTLHLVRAKPTPALVPGAVAELPAWLEFHVPLITYAVALLAGAGSRTQDTASHTIRRAGVLAATLFAALLFMQAVSRFDRIHLVPTQSVGLVVAVALAERAFSLSRSVVLKAGCLVLALLNVVPPISEALWSLARTTAKYPVSGCYSGISRASCVAVMAEQELAVAHVVNHTRPGEPIFVGNQRHDSIFVNELGFYFLADRPSPTKYAELYPGVATTLPVQKQIADDITRHGVRWVVLVAIPGRDELGEGPVPGGAHSLDDYLASHFGAVARFGKYEIRRGGEGPGG